MLYQITIKKESKHIVYIYAHDQDEAADKALILFEQKPSKFKVDDEDFDIHNVERLVNDNI